MAVENENPEVIDLLISAGVNVNVKDKVSSLLIRMSYLELPISYFHDQLMIWLCRMLSL